MSYSEIHLLFCLDKWEFTWNESRRTFWLVCSFYQIQLWSARLFGDKANCRDDGMDIVLLKLLCHCRYIVVINLQIQCTSTRCIILFRCLANPQYTWYQGWDNRRSPYSTWQHNNTEFVLLLQHLNKGLPHSPSATCYRNGCHDR